MSGPPSVHEYVGIIGISGRRKGAVCFTAPRSMLMVLLMRMNETDTSDETMRDLVGRGREHDFRKRAAATSARTS